MFGFSVSRAAFGSLVAATLLQAQSVEIAPVSVSGALQEPFSGSDGVMERTVSAQMLETLQATTSTNYFKSLLMLPSVNVETHDPYALTVDQNILRVRGQVGDTFSRISTTIDGVPFAVNVGQSGSGYVVDRENIEGVSFANGIIPVNRALGLGSTAGALDMKIQHPSAVPSAHFSAALGSDRYNKLFLRLDSGVYGGFGLFASGSRASNEKWRGEGDIKRDNFSAMIEWDLGDTVKADLFGAYNRFERHEYRPLTYAQTKALS
ncbi:MAG: hypothetical protein JXK05_05660 [Campylobacterales bacterium]|nr:hypothetical protein [Campylobacterales bacterium]